MICVVTNIVSLAHSLYKYSSLRITNKSTPNQKNILYINSYDFTYSPTLALLEGIIPPLKKNNVHYEIIFLHCKEFPYSTMEEINYDIFKKKFSGEQTYDAILVSDEPAFEFISKFRDEIFSDIPVIFCGVNNPVRARKMNETKNFSGYYQDINLEDIINVAGRLSPYVSKVVALHDETFTSLGDMIQFKEVQHNFPQYTFSDINIQNLSLDEFADALENLENDSIVILMNSCAKLEENLPNTMNQEEFIAEHTHIPVYKYTADTTGNGLAGGKIQDYTKLGENAANLLLEVLNGRDINSIPLKGDDSGNFIFDKDVLKKYDLRLSSLPNGTQLVTAKNSFIEDYKTMLFPVMYLILSLVVIAVIFIFLTFNEHKNLKKLRDSQENLKYLAEHDFLTDLPNRHTVNEIFNNVSSRKADFAIILIDIDDFKKINDLYTHLCGDEVLHTLATRLKSLTIDGKFFVCRFGGDEFILMYTNGHMNEENPDLQTMLRVFNEPISFEDRKIFVQVSVGIVNSSNRYKRFYEYVADADIAMYHSKKNGKNQITVFDNSLKVKIQSNQEIEKILKDAIENDGIVVLYQPQIDTNTGDIYGYEALTRIKDSNLSPAQFIPVAEQNGLIIKIARIVTEKVVQQIAEWRRHGIELHKVSINYSYGQIKDDTYIDYLKGLLRTYDVSPLLIGIEITESLFIDNREKSISLFEEFNNIGVKLALDDFGTGYSSLSYLTYIPVEIVKIDKSIVDNYLNNDHGNFIKNIVRLIHSLNMKLTVEGVEYTWQYKILKDYHCDYIQGYIFSKPISGEDIEKFSVAQLD